MSDRRCALVIANFDYQDPFLSQLAAPARDAETLAAILHDPAIGGFDVRTILNQPSYAVNQEVETFFNDRQRDDLLLLYFSGHGVKDEDGQLYFAARDTNHKLLRSTAVWANFVNDVMRRSRSRRQVLMLDCCYSGAFARGMVAKGDSGIGTRERFEGRGRVVLAASDSMQYSFEEVEAGGASSSSIFTSALAHGLQSGEADLDGDGLICLDELFDYVQDRVSDHAPQQTPVKWALDVQGEIVIARNPRAAPKPVALSPDLREAIDSRFLSVREDAVVELGRLLNGSNRALAQLAREALLKLKEDDSRRIASAAEKCLGAVPIPEEAAKAVETPPPARAEPVPEPVAKAVAPEAPIAEPPRPAEQDQPRRQREQLAWQEATDRLERERLEEKTRTIRLWLTVALAAIAAIGVWLWIASSGDSPQVSQSPKPIASVTPPPVEPKSDPPRKSVTRTPVPPRQTPSPQTPSPAPAANGGAAEALFKTFHTDSSTVYTDPETQKYFQTTRVNPVYPPAAKAARIQGTVVFGALIGVDGSVRALQLVSGHPALVEAAKDAVQKWKYSATIVKGQPVPVVTNISVDFHLKE